MFKRRIDMDGPVRVVKIWPKVMKYLIYDFQEVTFREASEHSLFIPKEMFIGGR